MAVFVEDRFIASVNTIRLPIVDTRHENLLAARGAGVGFFLVRWLIRGVSAVIVVVVDGLERDLSPLSHVNTLLSAWRG